jgi:hypothetical protein
LVNGVKSKNKDGNKDTSYTLDAYIKMDEGFFEEHRKKADTRGNMDKLS